MDLAGVAVVDVSDVVIATELIELEVADSGLDTIVGVATAAEDCTRFAAGWLGDGAVVVVVFAVVVFATALTEASEGVVSPAGTGLVTICMTFLRGGAGVDAMGVVVVAVVGVD